MLTDEGGGQPWSFAGCPNTEWTVVLQAGEKAAPALERLCTRYRAPLLAFLIRQGWSPEDAEDLVQGFLADKLSNPGFLKGRDRTKGRFRTWVLSSLKNYATDEARRKAAAKRGGGVPAETLDTATGEHAPGRGVADPGVSPDEAFDRSWRDTLLGHALRQLKAEYVQQGKGFWFDLFEPLLYDDSDGLSYREIAIKIGRTESGARSAASRSRARMRVLIREEVARTVSDPEMIEDELRHLL